VARIHRSRWLRGLDGARLKNSSVHLQLNDAGKRRIVLGAKIARKHIPNILR
jgi:hypothetical protein